MVAFHHQSPKSICVALATVVVLCLLVTSGQGLRRQKRQTDAENRVSMCPDDCKCTLESDGRKFVKCANRNKKQIPIKIPMDVAVIDLEGNAITEVTAGYLDGHTYLDELDLSFNPITKIDPLAMRHLGRLTRLDLSHTSLENLTFSDLGESARSLEVLILSHTKIRHFPQLYDEAGGFLTNVRVLDLSYNYFEEVPTNSIPVSVEELDLSCMEVKKLTAVFANLQELKTLTMTGCSTQNTKLTNFGRKTFDDLPKLERLDLSYNSINTIPDRLPLNLKYLDLSNNRISRIKSSRCATQEEIRDNFASYIPEDRQDFQSLRLGSSLSRLQVLKNLTLTRNQIDIICSDDFMFMDSLEILDLSHCKIPGFPMDTFLYPDILTVLDLSYNSIRELEMRQMMELKELFLQRNYITHVKQIGIGTFPALTRADLSNNLFKCDCNLKQFVNFMKLIPQEIFDHLHPRSVQYTCADPPNLKGKNLLTLDPEEDLTCGEVETTFPYWAVAAPLSLVGLVILIVAVLCIARVRAGEKVCCCGKNGDKKKVVSNYAKYDSDIVIQDGELNDAAILCHNENHKWVQDVMMQKLKRNLQKSLNACDDCSVSQIENRQLNFEVFTIGKTIKIDTLHKCIDSNRKIALVLTHEFLQEKSCLYILKVIQERMAMDAKDAVVIVMLDALRWSDLPVPLQQLMAEKSFVQFPQRDRERQEFYFWESMCSLICTNDPKYGRDRWTEADEDELEEVRDDVTVTSSRYKPRPLARDNAEVEFGTIRSARRAPSRSIHDELPGIPVSATRAARLQRLGIKSNGEIADEVMHEVTEARNLARNRQYVRDITVVSNPSLDGTRMPPPSSIGRRANHLSRTTSHNTEADIDDLYHTRNDPQLPRKSGRVRSLLPPNCDDADSIYSDDVEAPVPGYEVRPPERDRPRPKLPRRHSHHRRRPSSCRSVEPASTKGSRRSSMTHDSVIDNLHGTMRHEYENRADRAATERSEVNTEVTSRVDEEEEEDAESKGRGEKKSFFRRLKSFF